LVPVVIFGFMDIMYLAKETAYREFYRRTVNRIRDGSYGLSNVYDASAPFGFRRVWSALTSWSVLPVYLGLIVAYLVAYWMGWLTALTAVAK
ncbi:MAG TPA: hypothetical protein VFH31_08690, partial [Pyrinomonadaceae bacterium]|nr:hypothetical protein [Pyrinomonadaceae bacterium]